jgi:hypothetical protein
MDALPRKKKGDSLSKKVSDIHSFNMVHNRIDSSTTLVASPTISDATDTELENHLIELSFLTFAGYSCELDFSVVIPSTRYFRPKQNYPFIIELETSIVLSFHILQHSSIFIPWDTHLFGSYGKVTAIRI